MRASVHGRIAMEVNAIACPNPDCKQLTLSATLWKRAQLLGPKGTYVGNETFVDKWNLMPRSKAKPQPEFIPEAIRQDYMEACLILGDSPKASATMSRRCLQGIVRDYWNIPNNKKGKLGAELSFIKENVSESTWSVIHTIREVGDIGAHMNKDVNEIVDVEHDEAELLIELIETLFQDWYIDRQNRLNRDARVKELARKKLEEKKNAKRPSKDNESNLETEELPPTNPI